MLRLKSDIVETPMVVELDLHFLSAAKAPADQRAHRRLASNYTMAPRKRMAPPRVAVLRLETFSKIRFARRIVAKLTNS
jgi:hypothetical protein